MGTQVTNVGHILLDPEVFLMDDNSRFALKPYRIARLAEEIERDGEIHTPIEAEPLESPVNGKKYRVTAGHYRVSAALELNKRGAGIEVPTIVKVIGDSKQRLLRQLSENMERENQSPMDQAVAIKRLLDAGVSKPEIRRIFAAATPGGRKGMTLQPASNSIINIKLQFLEFSKKIQQLIHDGTIPVTAAMELAKSPKEKWDAIVEDALADNEKQLKREAEDEEKFLAQAKKEEESEAKQAETLKAIEDAKALAEKAEADAHAAAEASAAAFKAASTANMDKKLTPEQKKAKAEEFKAAEAAQKVALKAANEAAALALKLETRQKEAAAKVEERKRQLELARKDAAKKKTLSPSDVKKSAAKAGSTPSNASKMTAADMRKTMEEWAMAGSYPKVQKIANIILAVYNNEVTAPEGYKQITAVTGEKRQAVGK